MSNSRKKIDKYTIHLEKKLGVGSFGTVYVGIQDETQLKVAIKMLDKKTSKRWLIQSIRMST
jgi:serine/threonine protein kinase